MLEYYEMLAARALAAWRESVDPSQSDVESLLIEANPDFHPLKEPTPETTSGVQKQDSQQSGVDSAQGPASDQQDTTPQSLRKKVVAFTDSARQWFLSRAKKLKGRFKRAPEGDPGSKESPKKPTGAEKRDFWQSEIIRALVPADGQQDANLHAQRKKVATVAARLCRLLRNREKELKTHFNGSIPEAEVRFTEDGWSAFLEKELDKLNVDLVRSPLSSAQPSIRRLADITDLIKTAVPVVARRLAAELTRKERIEEVFDKYGFNPNPPNAVERLKAYLEGGVLSQEPPLAKFKRWPPAAVSGSFSKDLACELDYMPSTWALQRELGWVNERRKERKLSQIDGDNSSGSAKKNESVSPKDGAWNANLLGLAFSGGGIRSATFNLGILQGLAKLGLLRRIDYLSTVSGGGYIGSWLINWIKHAGVNTVEHRLCPDATADPADPRVAPIHFLRDFSNYLTPRLGLLSADLWVMAVVWFRNTVLNLFVLIPTLLAILFLPRLAELWVHCVGRMTTSRSAPPEAYLLILGISVLCAVIFLARNLKQFPADRGDVEPTPVRRKQVYYLRPWGITTLIVLPIFLAAWFASLELWWYAGDQGSWKWWVFGGSACVALLILYGAKYTRNFKKVQQERWRKFAVISMFSIALALGGVTTLIVIGLEQIYLLWPHTCSPAFPNIHSASPVTVFGVPLVIFALFFVLILMVGLMSRNLPDGASRWLVRLRAYMAIYSVIWITWVGISVYGYWVDTSVARYVKWPAVGAWVWTTLRGVLAGKDPRTSGGKSDWKTSLGFYATVGPYVFIVGLLFFLSFVSQSAFLSMHDFLTGVSSPAWRWFLAISICLILSVFLAGIMSACVDVNEFSLNTFYRGRLVRAYLGAANTDRHPNPYTGFDPEDDYWGLASFRKTDSAATSASQSHNDAPLPEDAKENAGPYAGPFPIYNATVNLVHGDELAWQERKGASFTFTPELCGYETPWNAASNPYSFRKLDFLSYRDTNDYAYPNGGAHLGTPMSISGAALSPNMGSYTNAATGFLMTVFNARLGWWLGNPRHKTTWRQAGPTQGLAYLTKELLGLTNDRAGFVYVSDGGHFENLGIYELVRRRCRFIIACDAEEDQGFAFNGLGNAIRKCREDFGVEINTQVDLIHPDATTKLSRNHCVVGTIQYPDQAGFGYLVYIKASIVGDEPEDVLQYRVKCPVFPHQSTGDQWFTESQFESYRRLGLHIAETTFRRVVGDLTNKAESPDYTQLLFEQLRDIWYPPNKAIQKNFTRHAQALDALVHEMRSDNDLMQLDTVLIPLERGATVEVSETDKPKVFLFLSSVIQLMENIYIDLDLESNADHPHNAGWIQIFQAWAQSEIFRQAWNRYGWVYGRNFRRFCARRFGLPEA